MERYAAADSMTGLNGSCPGAVSSAAYLPPSLYSSAAIGTSLLLPLPLSDFWLPSTGVVMDGACSRGSADRSAHWGACVGIVTNACCFCFAFAFFLLVGICSQRRRAEGVEPSQAKGWRKEGSYANQITASNGVCEREGH
jgi:hypothetical protein